MEKHSKTLLTIIIVLLALNLIVTFFGGSSNLNRAIRNLEATRDTIHQAIAGITKAQKQIDEINSHLQDLKKTAERSELQVRIINQQMQLKMERSRSTVDSLQKEIQKNLEKLGNL